MKWVHLPILIGILAIVLVSGCVSDTGKITKKESSTYTPATESSESSSERPRFVIDDTYRRNADRVAWEAIDYCKTHPYGTYRTTIYNGDGLGVPFKIECS